MMLSRRSLLLSGTAAASLTAIGVPLSVLPGPGPGFRLLSVGEGALVVAIGGALFPPGNEMGVSAAEVDLALLVDDLLVDELDPVVQPVFRYLLRAVDAGTLASRGAPFAALSLEARQDVLSTWSDPAILPRRLGYEGLKSVLGMAFFNAPAVTDRFGWSPTCHRASS